MKRYILLCLCLISFSVFAQITGGSLDAKEIINPYNGNQIAAQKGEMSFKSCVGPVMESLV